MGNGMGNDGMASGERGKLTVVRYDVVLTEVMVVVLSRVY